MEKVHLYNVMCVYTYIYMYMYMYARVPIVCWEGLSNCSLSYLFRESGSINIRAEQEHCLHSYMFVYVYVHVHVQTCKTGGPEFDSRWLPWVFFSLPAGLLILIG